VASHRRNITIVSVSYEGPLTLFLSAKPMKYTYFWVGGITIVLIPFFFRDKIVSLPH